MGVELYTVVDGHRITLDMARNKVFCSSHESNPSRPTPLLTGSWQTRIITEVGLMLLMLMGQVLAWFSYPLAFRNGVPPEPSKFQFPVHKDSVSKLIMYGVLLPLRHTCSWCDA